MSTATDSIHKNPMPCDVLVDHDGAAQAIVISVGGFLGIGTPGPASSDAGADRLSAAQGPIILGT
jgi:hypothetical protein